MLQRSERKIKPKKIRIADVQTAKINLTNPLLGNAVASKPHLAFGFRGPPPPRPPRRRKRSDPSNPGAASAAETLRLARAAFQPAPSGVGKSDIDVVYTWVQDTQAHRQSRMRYLMEEAGKRVPSDNASNRYSDNGELKFSIRSIYAFCPWVNRIFIVAADGQRPDWLTERSEDCNIPITVVPHSELFGPDFAGHLPTFNSQAIEVHLHRIPGLSERFLYFNDDMFVGRAMEPTDFFTRSGAPKYQFGGPIPKKTPRRGMSKHAYAWINNGNVLDALFPFTKSRTRRYPMHQGVPMLKSSFDALWQMPVARQRLERTSASRFRRANNLYVIGLLVYWNAYNNKVAKSNASHAYVELTDRSWNNFSAIRRRRPKLFCVNDGLERNRMEGAYALQSFLAQYYPNPTIAEAEAEAGTQSASA